MATKYPLDGSEPPVNIGGRPPALKPEHIPVLHDIVTERAQASCHHPAYLACTRHRPPQAETKGIRDGIQSAQALWLHGSASARRCSHLQYQSD